MRTSRSVTFPWIRGRAAAAATIAAMQALRSSAHDRGYLHDLEEKALAVVQQALLLSLGNRVSHTDIELTHDEAGLLTLLDNVGSSLATDIAQHWMRRRMPDQTRGVPEHIHTDIFIPWRILDAAGIRSGDDPKRIPADVLAAFDAIWMAEEYASAYAYVNGLITVGGAAFVQQP